MNKKIAVVGTGANGGGVAAELTRAGLDVVLIDQWPEHVEAMRANGLELNFPDETVVVPVEAYHLCDVCTLNRMFDYVLVMVKAYDTRWACELIKPYLKEDGLLVGVQNAMMLNDIEEIVGPERTLGCVMEMSSEIFTPGVIQRNTTHAHTWFGVGAVNEATEPRVGEIEALLKHVGQVSISSEIISAKWMKLVVNTMCLGPFAMMGLTLYEAMKIPGMREFTLRAGTEALAVGQRIGHTIQPIFGLTEDDVRDTNRLLEKMLDKLAADIGPAARDCVLQDHLKGRYSEVDLINGLVVEEGVKNGQPTPVNAAVTEITRRIQSGELEPDPSNLARALELVNA
jgi:2-dehydropantoate 2-reductase